MMARASYIANLVISGLFLLFAVVIFLAKGKQMAEFDVQIYVPVIVIAALFIFFDILCLNLFVKNKQRKFISDGYRERGRGFAIVNMLCGIITAFGTISLLIDTIGHSDGEISYFSLFVIVITCLVLAVVTSVANTFSFLKALTLNRKLRRDEVMEIGNDLVE